MWNIGSFLLAPTILFGRQYATSLRGALEASSTVGNRYDVVGSQGHYPRVSSGRYGKCPSSFTSSEASFGELHRCRPELPIPVTTRASPMCTEATKEVAGGAPATLPDASPRRLTKKSQERRTPDHHPRCFDFAEADNFCRHCPFRRFVQAGIPPSTVLPQRYERPEDIEDYLRQQHTTPLSSKRRFRTMPRRPSDA